MAPSPSASSTSRRWATGTSRILLSESGFAAPPVASDLRIRTLSGVAQEQPPHVLLVVHGRLGRGDEVAQDPGEADRVVVEREMPRILEDLEPAAGHRGVRRAAVAGGDHRV